MTRSTPSRLYQLRSKITISPPAGKCSIYRWIYSWLFSQSEGAGSAVTRKTSGLTRSVGALIVPPSPAKNARAHSSRQRFDRAALACRVPSFKDDDDSLSLGLHPFLQMAQLDLKLQKLLFVSLAFHSRVRVVIFALGHGCLPNTDCWHEPGSLGSTPHQGHA